MSRPRLRLWPLAAVALLAACSDGRRDGTADGAPELPAEGEDFIATLCFADTDGLLRCAPQAVPAGGIEATAAAIVQALIDGPGAVGIDSETPGPAGELLPVLPPAVELQALDLIGAIAYVDLTVREAGAGARLERPAMDLSEELLAVYSLVNSLTASGLGIEQVVLMWNGEQRWTFAGHVDTTRPLLPDPGRNAESAATDGSRESVGLRALADAAPRRRPAG